MDYRLKELPQDLSLATLIDIVNAMGLTFFGKSEKVQELAGKYPELLEPAITTVPVSKADLARPN